MLCKLCSYMLTCYVNLYVIICACCFGIQLPWILLPKSIKHFSVRGLMISLPTLLTLKLDVPKCSLQQNFLRIRIFLGSLKINHQILYSYSTFHRMHAHECHIESSWRQVKPWNMYAYIIWHYKCMEFHSFI